jgi:hypothetical protein
MISLWGEDGFKMVLSILVDPGKSCGQWAVLGLMLKYSWGKFYHAAPRKLLQQTTSRP